MKRLLVLLLALLPSLASAQTYTIAPPPFLTAFDNVGAIINNGCVWTYLAGTTTAATTYSTSSGSANSNPIRSDSAGRFTVFLSPGVSYKFVYEAPCTPPAHGVTLRTADNISAMPASAATVDVTGIAGEAISAGQCVYLSDGSGGKTTGQWYTCDTTNTYSSSAAVSIGLAPVAIPATTHGAIRLEGQVAGLSVAAGSTYYASTAGAIASTPAANRRQLGIADSATSVIVERQPTSITNDGTVGGPLKGYDEETQAATIATGVVTVNYALGNHILVPLTANITGITVTNIPPSPKLAALVFYYTADGTPRTIAHTINSLGVRWPGGVAPTMTSTNGKLDVVTYWTTSGGALWYANVMSQAQ